MIFAGVYAESFAKAHDYLRELADLDISDERIRRSTLRVGQERSQDRQRRVEEFLRKPLPVQSYGKPANIPAPAMVCVMANGGRFQILDRKQPGHDGEHWRESRIAMFLELKAEVHASDPTPELPAFLHDDSLPRRLPRSAASRERTPPRKIRSPELAAPQSRLGSVPPSSPRRCRPVQFAGKHLAP